MVKKLKKDCKSKNMTPAQKEKYTQEIKSSLGKNQTLEGDIGDIEDKHLKGNLRYPIKCLNSMCKSEDIIKQYIPYHYIEISNSDLSINPFGGIYVIGYICKTCDKEFNLDDMLYAKI